MMESKLVFNAFYGIIINNVESALIFHFVSYF